MISSPKLVSPLPHKRIGGLLGRKKTNPNARITDYLGNDTTPLHFNRRASIDPNVTNQFQLSNIQSALRRSVKDCRERGLYQSAKWSAELLTAMVPVPSAENSQSMQFSSSNEETNFYLEVNDSENDHYLTALTYFDLREMERCVHELQINSCKRPKAMFLRYYAMYLVGEKKKEEKNNESQDIFGSNTAVNTFLHVIDNELSTQYAVGTLDGFLLYVYGLTLSRMKVDCARDVLIESLNKYPCNWSAWLELSRHITTKEDFDDVMSKISETWMKDFYVAQGFRSHHQNLHSLAAYENLLKIFPSSSFINSEKAVAHYGLNELSQSQELFEAVIGDDPYRVDTMDTYSNVLFVIRDKAALNHLACHLSNIDRYKAETCAVSGNYFSLSNDHQKAINYFERALRLNRYYVEGWTLMGHEFMQMSNKQAAIEAYRNAIDLDPRDTRAWYGLGQAYELCREFNMAKYYFQKVTNMKSSDGRAWIALGDCHEKLHQLPQALKCFQHANTIPNSNVSLVKFARLYGLLGDSKSAAYYHEKALNTKDEIRDAEDATESLLFLANYYEDEKRYEEAEKHAIRVLEVGTAPDKEAASDILNRIRFHKPNNRKSAGYNDSIFF